MGKIFISYRRDDTITPAVWIRRIFSDWFGEDKIFLDMDTIIPGDDFADRIDEWVAQTDVMLVLIGRQWATVTDADTGRPRLEDPKDFVRLEIKAALDRHIVVIPVLLDGADLPARKDLPEPIEGERDIFTDLLRKHAFTVAPARFEADVETLARQVRKTLRQAEKARRKAERAERGFRLEGPARYWVPAAGAAGLGAVLYGGNLVLTAMGVYEPRPFVDLLDRAFIVETPGCDLCPDLVSIPGGRFTMGSPRSEAGREPNETPIHEVRIDQFLLGRYEVTWDEWQACVAGGGCDGAGPAAEGGDEGWGQGSRPVINVSWADAQAYVTWLSGETGHAYRLPTEAEWEYAARAGSPGRYAWGDQDPICNENAPDGNGANFAHCEDNRPRPVTAFQPSAFLLHNMHGNVAEWVQDCYADGYSGAPADGSARLDAPGTPIAGAEDGCDRVVRGGSFRSAAALLRSARRSGSSPGARFDRRGFRVARDGS